MFRPPKPKPEEKPKEKQTNPDEKPKEVKPVAEKPIIKGGGAPRLASNEITYQGVAIDTRIIRLLTALDKVTVDNLLNPHPVSGTVAISNLLNPHPVSISSPLVGGRLDIRLLSSSDVVTVDNLLNPHPVSLSTLLNPHPVTQLTRTNLLTKPEREDLTNLGGVASPNNAGVQVVAGVAGQKVKVYDAGYHAGQDGLHYFYFGTTTTSTTRRLCTCNKALLIHKTFVQPRIGNSGDGLYIFSSVAETNMPYDIGYVQQA